MRFAGCAFGLLVWTIAHAAPPSDELERLRTQLRAVEAKHDYAAAIPLAEKLVDLATQRGGRDGKEAIAAREDLARDLDRADEYTRSLKEYQELAVLAEKQHGESQQLISALEGLSIPLGPLQRYDEVEAVQRRILALSEKLDGVHSDDYRRHLSILASTLFYQRNDFTQAMQLYDRILKLADELGPSGVEAQYAAALEVGHIYWQLDRRPRAIALLDRALQLSD